MITRKIILSLRKLFTSLCNLIIHFFKHLYSLAKTTIIVTKHMKHSSAIILFTLLGFLTFGQEKLSLEIKFNDYKTGDKKFVGVNVKLGQGFDEHSSNVQIFLNETLLLDVKCKSDLEMGYCISKDGMIGSIFIEEKDFSDGDRLKIQYEGDYGVIPLTKSYPDLLIEKFKETWTASYIKGTKNHIQDIQEKKTEKTE